MIPRRLRIDCIRLYMISAVDHHFDDTKYNDIMDIRQDQHEQHVVESSVRKIGEGSNFRVFVQNESIRIC